MALGSSKLCSAQKISLHNGASAGSINPPRASACKNKVLHVSIEYAIKLTLFTCMGPQLGSAWEIGLSVWTHPFNMHLDVYISMSKSVINNPAPSYAHTQGGGRELGLIM